MESSCQAVDGEGDGPNRTPRARRPAAGCGSGTDGRPTAPLAARRSSSTPRRLQRRPRPSLLADGAGDHVRVYEEEGLRVEVTVTDRTTDDRGDRGARRSPRRRHRGRTGRRGHVRLVRAGPRVGTFGTSARTRPSLEDGKPVSNRRAPGRPASTARQAGSLLPAQPEAGAGHYRQEYYAGKAEDRAKVLEPRRVGEGAPTAPSTPRCSPRIRRRSTRRPSSGSITCATSARCWR